MSRDGYDRLLADLQAGKVSEQADDLPLFARSTDPGTSWAAAKAAAPHAATQRAAVLACLRQYGAMTYRELDDRLQWRTGAQRRLPELAASGLIRPTGTVRENCRVWEAA